MRIDVDSKTKCFHVTSKRFSINQIEHLHIINQSFRTDDKHFYIMTSLSTPRTNFYYYGEHYHTKPVFSI